VSDRDATATTYALPLELGVDLLAELRAHATHRPLPLWLDGVGALAEPSIDIATSTGERLPKALTGVWDLLSLKGTVSPDGRVELYALVAREGPAGQEILGGVLRRARVVHLELRLTPTHAAGEAPGVTPTPAPTRAQPSSSAGSNRGFMGSPPQPGTFTPPMGAALPPRRPRPDDGLESYPEEGDHVSHFAFGRCVVVFSDGERIRLQQERDGRIREVALSMLRIEAPTLDADGHRSWELLRKN